MVPNEQFDGLSIEFSSVQGLALQKVMMDHQWKECPTPNRE